MALQTLVSSLNVKIAGTTTPAASGADLDGFIKDGTQTGIFVWCGKQVNVLARTTGATTWTVVEHLTSDNRTALVSWDDYDVVAFQSQTGGNEKVRIIPRFDTMVATTADPVEVPRINKFSDLPEVPAYTGADSGQVFKVGVGGVLELSNPPNFNTQTSTFPSVVGIQSEQIINTTGGDALLLTPSFSNGLVLSSFEATGTQVGGGVTLGNVNESNFIASNAADIDVNSYIMAEPSANNNIADDFTVSMWFNRQASVIYPRLFMAHNHGQFLVHGNMTIHIYQPTGQLTVYSNNPYSPVPDQMHDWVPANCPVIQLNRWYHLVLTRTTATNTMEMWIDGTSVGTLVDPIVNSTFSFTSVAEPSPTLGWLHAANDGSYTGKIEQACLWNRALSQGEVETLYNSNISDVTPLSTVSIPNTDPVTDIIIKGSNFESTSKVYLFNETDIVYDTSLSDALLATPEYSNGLVLSSFEATGTQVGGGVTLGNVSTSNFIANNVADIDVNSYIMAEPNAAYNTQDFTVSMWFNRQPSAIYPRLFMAHNYNQFLVMGNMTLLIHQNTGQLWVYSGASGNTTGQIDWIPAGAPAIALNQWYHVVLTRDTASSTMQMWLDGVSLGTLTGAAANSVLSLTTVAEPSPTLGWLHAANDGSYAGKIEQACMWNRALEPAEVVALYNSNITPKTMSFYENYENTAINNIMGTFAGEAGLKLPADNFEMFTKGNTELLVGWTEINNEYAGKVPLVFKNSNELNLRINPAGAAGTYSLLIVNPDGNKNLYRNCIVIQ